MALAYYYTSALLLSYNLLHCIHGHSMNNIERELDGSYRARDSEHYGDSGDHHAEFDHEAILGSVKEAEEYYKLSPEESRRRLALLLPRMDLDGDQHVDRYELKKWILISFNNLSREEAAERLAETDDNRDGVVTWSEYLQETFGVGTEAEVQEDDINISGMLVTEEKAMWAAADVNGDGVLSAEEFAVFTSPEEHESMHGFVLNQTLRERDSNKDGRIDFSEYIGDRGEQQDKEWLLSEREKFDHDDTDGNGELDTAEIHRWLIPSNDETAEAEVVHLFAMADDNHDNRLSFEEILENYEMFVGSDVTQHEDDALGDHFDDEL